MTNSKKGFSSPTLIIIVASLGYFVDIYDLTLFNVVKHDSLSYIKDLTEGSFDVAETGMKLFNWQMTGMLIGGILWGIWGDKKGRVNVLFGSILLYSIANIANAFCFDIRLYSLIRFIAGIGLAGELGAGITLVTETMKKENRGYGTMIIATFGALGAVLAGFIGAKGQWITDLISSTLGYQLQNWQTVYLIGGALGLLLLALRVGAFESGMFHTMTTQENVRRGDFFSLFKRRKTFIKYISCIAIGLPVWFFVGILVAQSQDIFSKELGADGVINGMAVSFAYIGLSVGDFAAGFFSQILKSRKKAIYIFNILLLLILVSMVFFIHEITASEYYFLIFLGGLSSGIWAIFVTTAAEQFGTNIRSTVANTVPNFVRGSVVPITTSFAFLAGTFGNLYSAFIVGMICIGLSMLATYSIEESFAADLDYFENS